MWKVILFAHDFSDCAARVEPLVLDLSSTLCAKVVVCHVSPIPHGLHPDTIIRPPGELAPMKVAEYTLQSSQARLDEIGQRLQRDCVSVETTARLDDDIARGILESAKEHHADVIVMGTHGRAGLQHLFLGSIAEKVLRQAEVPVVTLRTPAKRAEVEEEAALEDERSG
jgi:nucleotide-binding universal stress UspA family protein